ncbi:acyltransferase family protein [Flavihumibacter rivuli]|uniref:acyltransferase family protein n=1 Tax=Flavihumibacter rivuli TaxID=2838156 RepID=UPI001BDF4899|nr:acyltransferase family protein [Flavihumibacter rivuli]ULQ57008.1 acyltransferase family protein [Flavihumibacter rivuli]
MTNERKHYIDWVRVLAFFILIFFHCAMPFVTFGWEIKNSETSVGLSRLVWWLHQWRLPLLFFISGVGIHFSLKRRSVFAFAGERIVRLFIPLFFAMFFTIPLQVYFEYTQKGRISGSYADFYPTVWEMVPYPEGSLTWSHMWFVVYLFVFCMLLLPVFGIFRIKALERLKTRIANAAHHPLLMMIPVLPLLYYYLTLFIRYPEQQSLLDDWFLFLSSLTLLFYGYFLAGSQPFWDACQKYRKWFLGTALVCSIFLFARYWWNMTIPKEDGSELFLYGLANSLHIWCIILAALGFAKQYLNFSNPFLVYANEAVYPFYILHQTLIVAFGYYVTQWNLPILVKMILLILATFIGLALVYRWLIRPFILTRVLFGMKPRRKELSGTITESTELILQRAD